MKNLLFVCLSFLVVFSIGNSALATEPRFLVAFPASDEAAVRAAGMSIWARSGGVMVASAGDEALRVVADAGIAPILRVPDTGQLMFLFHHDERMAAPSAPEATVRVLSPTVDLFLYPAGTRITHPPVKPYGAFMGVPRQALEPLAVHPADLVPATESALVVNPLVTQIVNATSQANWFQYVNDLSGENSVLVGGVMRTINSRYSDAMFPTPRTNAYATEYLLEKGAGWGYSGVRETYTSANSGCGGAQTIPWQNVVFTIPGQVDFGLHQQVIFVTHYDSLSYSSAENFAYAPGADDAISGGSALIEAMRLFKDYAFEKTVKIIFFSGEEEGLCGSQAYVHQHPTADMWRVVNMDQTAYDGNLNRLMDCYNWSLASSPNSVSLGDAFVQANSDYGPIITPANIVRDTTHMCQTDHCPFWDAGVAAIALCEDLHNNDINPCFDQFQTATCHDTVTQVDPNHAPRLLFDQAFSWPTQKASIALVASLANPLYACPAAAPNLTATPANHAVNLSWDVAAGVTNYVVERAASCAGPFTPLTSVAGTSYNDAGLTNGTSYAYRIRTCGSQTSACMTAIPVGASATYQPGSAVVVADSGDHDLVPDNCELVTASFNVVNDGSIDLTGVKLGSLVSEHPGVQIVTALPPTLGDLAIGQAMPVSFKFYLGRNGTSAACNESIPFTAEAYSDQSALIQGGFSFLAEKATQSGTLSYDFDSDFSGWTVSTGSFTRVAGGAPGSTAFSLHSRSANNICDAILSPVFTPSGTSAMTMWVNFSIEGNAGAPSRWDRAVVRVVNTTNGTKTLITPTGVAYNTTGTTTGLCDGIGSLQGWSGDRLVWSQASFNLAAFSGIPIQIEARFSTDGSTLGTQGANQGFWFDQVAVTNATGSGCDAQSNVCQALPDEVSPTGSPTPFTIGKSAPNETLTFSEVPGATSYHLYVGTLASLETGIYDHAAQGGLCGFTDALPGDGSVSALAPLPENSYALAVAASGAGESIYGIGTPGTIPMALSTCP